MKKQNWVQRLINRAGSKVKSWFSSDPETDMLLDNEYAIMKNLFNGTSTRLTTKQSMELFDRVEAQYYAKIGDRFFDLHHEKDTIEKEIELITKYRNGKEKK